MTEDFRAFFDLVQKAAEDHGIGALIVCGVTLDGTGSNVRVASSGFTRFESKDEKFHERCIDAMGESLDLTLARLGGFEDDEGPAPQFVN